MRRAALPVAVAVAVVAAAAVISSVLGPTPTTHSGAIPTATPTGPALPTPKASTVDVRLGSLTGEQVATAAQQLRRQGLSVQVIWRHTDAQPPGTVLSVSPSGQRPVGSLVTLTGALRPKHSGDGGQGGDGNGSHGRGHHGHGAQGDLAAQVSARAGRPARHR